MTDFRQSRLMIAFVMAALSIFLPGTAPAAGPAGTWTNFTNRDVVTSLAVAGDSLWAGTIGGGSLDIAFSITSANDGAFAIVGATKSYGAGESDVYLVKVNDAGDTLWTRTYGGAGKDEGHHVIQANDGGFLIAGMTESSGAGGSDAYVVKVDSVGAIEWSHTYGGAERD